MTSLDQRLHDTGWGLLLILTGLVAAVPQDRVPEGAWLIGVAAILLGLNLVRYLRQIPVSGLSIALGCFALAAGLGRSLGVDWPLFAICLVVIGISLAVKPWFGTASH